MISVSGSMIKRGLSACIFIAAAGLFYTQYQANALSRQIANCKAYKENPESAIQVCTELLSDSRLSAAQKQAALYRFRGRAYAGMKDWPNALADFDTILELYPNSLSAWRWKGHILHKMDDYTNALSAFETALSFDPANQYSLRKKQYILWDMGRLEEVEVNYQSLLADYPEEGWIPRDLGRFYNQQEKHAEAFAQFKSALSIEWNDKRTRQGLHEACMHLGESCPALFPETREGRDVKSCEVVLSEAREIVSDDPKMQFALGNPNTAWIVASATYVGAAVSITSESSDETANRLILFDRLMACTKDDFEAGILSEAIEQNTGVQQQLEEIFGSPVREVLLDLAYAELSRAE